MVREYKIITHYDIEDFIEEVNKYLECDWMLVGGVNRDYNGMYMQAIVKIDLKEEIKKIEDMINEKKE
jgi:Ni,Fe-hydrogenase III large subunit